MAAFFVTGSGTDIGKTWICAGLLAAWRARGLSPEALKPVVSGFDPAAAQASDPAVLLRALGRTADADAIEAMAPFRFLAPLSPDQAAAQEGRTLSAAVLADQCRRVIASAGGPVLIEGAGGIMSPLSRDETMLDLAAAVGAPVLFVAGSYLGALSHALTGLAALKARGVAVRAVLVNESAEDSVGLQQTLASLAPHGDGIELFAIERNATPEAFQALAARLAP